MDPMESHLKLQALSLPENAKYSEQHFSCHCT